MNEKRFNDFYGIVMIRHRSKRIDDETTLLQQN